MFEFGMTLYVTLHLDRSKNAKPQNANAYIRKSNWLVDGLDRTQER